MDTLTGKVAVITGAASGIGRAVAIAAAAEGMKVVLADIEERALDETARSLAGDGADILAVVTDVSDGSSVETLRERALERFGAVHFLHGERARLALDARGQRVGRAPRDPGVRSSVHCPGRGARSQHCVGRRTGVSAALRSLQRFEARRCRDLRNPLSRSAAHERKGRSIRAVSWSRPNADNAIGAQSTAVGSSATSEDSACATAARDSGSARSGRHRPRRRCRPRARCGTREPLLYSHAS
jgi:hypothetical protein